MNRDTLNITQGLLTRWSTGWSTRCESRHPEKSRTGLLSTQGWIAIVNFVVLARQPTHVYFLASSDEGAKGLLRMEPTARLCDWGVYLDEFTT